MVNVLKFQALFLFLFSIEILVIRTGIHKMHFIIASGEDPDQTACEEAICQIWVCAVCGNYNVRNFRTPTISRIFKIQLTEV